MVTSLQRAVEPVTRKSGAILKTPISRPDWMLSNDDVELQLKIGSVCICSSHFNRRISDNFNLQSHLLFENPENLEKL